MTAPADWSVGVPENIGRQTQNTLWMTGNGRYLAITRSGPDTVEAWIEQVTTAEQLVATEPVPVEIGGASGYRVDLNVSEAASTATCFNEGRCYTLFQDESGYWPVEEGRTTRAWFVDVDGETLAIVTDSRDAGFDAWATVVEGVLSTLEWTP